MHYKIMYYRGYNLNLSLYNKGAKSRKERMILSYNKNMFKTYETELAGRKLVIETGKMAGLANGSVLVRYGDTCVLVNVTASKEPREGIDFFHYQ